MSSKLHYYLIAGQVMFTFHGDAEETPRGLVANAIVRHTEKVFPAAKIAKAQMNLQKSMLIKMPEELHASINMVDVIVTNVSYLGYMSEKEFQAPPEGMTIAEVLPDFEA